MRSVVMKKLSCNLSLSFSLLQCGKATDFSCFHLGTIAGPLMADYIPYSYCVYIFMQIPVPESFSSADKAVSLISILL